jgi:hypothetical protein
MWLLRLTSGDHSLQQHRCRLECILWGYPAKQQGLQLQSTRVSKPCEPYCSSSSGSAFAGSAL